MKRLLNAILAVGSSRALPPLVIGFFFLLYIGIAFFTDETLIALMALTSKSFILAAILALIPLNRVFCVALEMLRHLKMRRVMNGKTVDGISELFDETHEINVSPPVLELESRLAAEGYRTRHFDNKLAAWRGISIFPARLLFLAGTFCLFSGILISITTRTSQRRMVIEGEQLPTPEGTGCMVERIALENSSGLMLARTLTMEIAPGSEFGRRTFRLYPPSMYGGVFVYPRYLGIDLHLRFSAPDLPSYETNAHLNTFPPGKEASVVIPDSPYRIIFSILAPDAGNERYIAYMTGKVTLQFKLLKGNEMLFTGSAPGGGEFLRDGYRLALPNIRRLVVTDFIGDYGVLFILGAALLLVAAVSCWLPIRIFYPRAELLFICDSGVTKAYSHAEGEARRHAGVFHEAIDLIDASNKASE